MLELDEAAVESWICPTNASPQPYQQEIIKDALMSNGLIILPADIDRILIMNVVLYNFGRYFPGQKCVMLAPSSETAVDAKSGFNRMVGNESASTVLLAQQTPTERGLLWSSRTYKYYFTTPQTFNNDILNRNCSLDSISTIVFNPLEKLLQLLIARDLIRTIRESDGCHRVLAFSDVSTNLIGSATESCKLLQSQHVSCYSMHSGPFSVILEKLEIIHVNISEDHRVMMDNFEHSCIKPIVDKITACNPSTRFPPVGKLSAQIVSRIKENYYRNHVSHEINVLFDQLLAQLRARDDMQYNGYHQLEQASRQHQLHPKALACKQYVEQHQSHGRVVIISACRRTCIVLRAHLNGSLVLHVDELRDCQIGQSDQILFTGTQAFFYDQQCSDRILVNAGSVGVLLLENCENLLFERSMQALQEAVLEVRKLGCKARNNSISLPIVPELVKMAFDTIDAPDVLMTSRPERAFITEKMLADAPYPTFDRMPSLGGASFRVGRGVKSQLFQQIMMSVDQISFASENVVSHPIDFIESWIARHSGLVNLSHFFVPDYCYLPISEPPKGHPENVKNRVETGRAVEDQVVKRVRGQIIESSDQLSSPVFKRPRKDFPATAKSDSRFVDIEAGVSGSDIEDDELGECSSMLDFIDDRSEVTLLSSYTAAESQSQCQVAQSSMMAFYRQSLLSSQPSAFSQPANRFGRKLKVKIPSIDDNAEDSGSIVYSSSTNASPSASSTEVLGSALQDMDWSDEDLGI